MPSVPLMRGPILQTALEIAHGARPASKASGAGPTRSEAKPSLLRLGRGRLGHAAAQHDQPNDAHAHAITAAPTANRGMTEALPLLEPAVTRRWALYPSAGTGRGRFGTLIRWNLDRQGGSIW